MTDLHEKEIPPREAAESSLEAEWDNFWKSDRADALGWVAIFLWGALVIVAENTNFRDEFSWWDAWGVFFAGAGVIVLIETAVRLAMPQYRSKWGWTLFWGCAFLALGLGGLASPIWYALPLVAIAIAILSGVLARSR